MLRDPYVALSLRPCRLPQVPRCTLGLRGSPSRRGCTHPRRRRRSLPRMLRPSSCLDPVSRGYRLHPAIPFPQRELEAFELPSPHVDQGLHEGSLTEDLERCGRSAVLRLARGNRRFRLGGGSTSRGRKSDRGGQPRTPRFSSGSVGAVPGRQAKTEKDA